MITIVCKEIINVPRCEIIRYYYYIDFILLNKCLNICGGWMYVNNIKTNDNNDNIKYDLY